MSFRKKPVIYVQIAADRLTVKDVTSGETISEVPEVAIAGSPKPKIVGVGSAARTAASGPGVNVVNPFAHPRSLVSDFTVGEQLVKAFLSRLHKPGFLSVAPLVVIHPLGRPDGGFTQVERRAFREMAIGAGASEVIVWTGRNLTDQEVLSRQFPVGEGEGE